MSNLSPEQRKEVSEMMITNNQVLISSFKDSMHEIIDPLKDSVNKALGNYDILNTKIEENAEKIKQIFVFHNKNEERHNVQNLRMVEIKNETAKANNDINAIAEKLRDNRAEDEKTEAKLDEISMSIGKAQASYKTLSVVGGVLLTIMGIVIAILEMS